LQNDARFGDIIHELSKCWFKARAEDEEMPSYMQSRRYWPVNRQEVLKNRRDRYSIRNNSGLHNIVRLNNNFTRASHNETDQSANGRFGESVDKLE
jgi:hypothetical protein